MQKLGLAGTLLLIKATWPPAWRQRQGRLHSNNAAVGSHSQLLYAFANASDRLLGGCKPADKTPEADRRALGVFTPSRGHATPSTRRVRIAGRLSAGDQPLAHAATMPLPPAAATVCPTLLCRIQGR